MQADLLVHHISQLVTLAGPPGPRRGAAMRELAIVEDGAVAILGERIVAVGHRRELEGNVNAREKLDAGGRAVIPGLIDAHTHVPWVGERAGEFEMRLRGATYMQIMAAGGGIRNTVTATRQASLARLVEETRIRLDRMLAHGTTTAEAKTGYGLTTRDELKQLDAIAELQSTHPIDLVPTFMGAHAVPAEYEGHRASFVDLVIHDMLPATAARWQMLGGDFPPGWPIFCDVFCEPGAFDVAESRAILEAARQHEFGLKIHVDEFAPLGGTLLAVELGATSADHLVATPAEHLSALARSQTIGVALPGTPFGLAHSDYTPGRALIDQDGALALATDLNPGTCWCESMQFMIALACRYMQLLPSEALTAATINAGCAIGVGEHAGSLEPGKLADMVILDTADYRALGYRFGTNLAHTVIKRGRIV